MEPHFAFLSLRSAAMQLKKHFVRTQICPFSTSKTNFKHTLEKINAQGENICELQIVDVLLVLTSANSYSITKNTPAMNSRIEARRARQNRAIALFLTFLFHLALIGGIYYYTHDDAQASEDKAEQIKNEQEDIPAQQASRRAVQP